MSDIKIDEAAIIPEAVRRLPEAALAVGAACQRELALLEADDRRDLLVSLLSAEINRAAVSGDFTDVLERTIAGLALTALAEASGQLEAIDELARLEMLQ